MSKTARLVAESLYASPNALAQHYGRFDVANRLLLTGHSHQAWPDAGFRGQVQAWADAATYVDDKWEHAFARADRVRAGYARLLGCEPGEVALAESTHDLLIRFLSLLPLRDRPRLVTTDGEFHTIRRQLDRLAEEGLEVVKVARDPVETVAERLGAAVDGRTAAALVSSVFYLDARIALDLDSLAEACRTAGARLLVDAYHHLNVLPFSLRGLEDAYVTGGGYKYMQLGEGNAFLRVPPADADPRPIVTGWFAEFGALAPADWEGVQYAEGPTRFAGSTYDPTSQYRAAAVLDFFVEQGLDPELLREVSQHQRRVMVEAIDALDLDPAVLNRDRSAPIQAYGGFVALRSPVAGELLRLLAERGVATDRRGDVLRLGPAPYLSDSQIERAAAALGEAVRALRG